MQKLILLLLLLAPFGLFAQSHSEAKLAHQEAENLLVNRYPQAQKIDIEALTLQQKDDHKTCSSCQKKKQKTQESGFTISPSRSLELLKKDQERLSAIVKNMHNSQSQDTQLLAKYERAIFLNNEKIKLAKIHLSNQQQLKNKLSSK